MGSITQQELSETRMDLRKLQRVVIDALEDIKAQDIVVFDTSGLTASFDRIVIASATSNRQTRALASHVRDQAKAAGACVVGTEGEDTGEWVLVDLGDVVVHIMQPAIRQYYNLEEVWGEKKVRVKLNGGRPLPAGISLDPNDTPNWQWTGQSASLQLS